jgi:hypothetical protein
MTPSVMEEIAPGEPYSFGGGRFGPSYDWGGDPLGARDLFPPRARLFDRKDRAELTNLSDTDPERAERMRLRLVDLRRESLALGETLGAGGQSPPVGEEGRDQLVALGYMAPLPETGGILEVPMESTDFIEAPDMTPLYAHDHYVHEIRIQTIQGVELGPEQSQQLSDASRAYARWGAAHPDYSARSQWRIREVEALAKSAGIALDTDSPPPVH